MPTEDTILLQKKYIQTYYIWVLNDHFFHLHIHLKYITDILFT